MPLRTRSLPSWLVLASFAVSSAFATPAAIEPVTPDALPETRALLQLLHDLSGKHTLTGQHNYPAIKDRNTRFATHYTGHRPAVFSTDFGFAAEGDTDSYLARPELVQECIRQHRLGALVTICWHAVPPTADEPVTFQPRPGSDPHRLASVQGQLLDEQFRDVLTPGTALHAQWIKQVDAIAVFLKQLETARVPVLWRPYHEMNGSWFWWGGRTGEFSTVRLYRQIFDRLVHHHGLKNLVWVWSVDRVSKPGMEHEKFFPGLDYLDVLGLDVYGNDFAQSYYESLEKLSGGKPLALAEVGNPPALEVLARQPKWTFYAVWAGMVRNTTRAAYAQLMADPRLVNLDDPAYAKIVAPYRDACGLPPVKVEKTRPNFSGHWVINEELSHFGRGGASSAPASLDVVHEGDALHIRSTRVLEFADDQVTEDRLTLDGAEVRSEFLHSPRATRARVTPDGQAVSVASTITPSWGPAGSPMQIEETWHLIDGRQRLSIERTVTGAHGTQSTTLIFDRR